MGWRRTGDNADTVPWRIYAALGGDEYMYKNPYHVALAYGKVSKL